MGYIFLGGGGVDDGDAKKKRELFPLTSRNGLALWEWADLFSKPDGNHGEADIIIIMPKHLSFPAAGSSRALDDQQTMSPPTASLLLRMQGHLWPEDSQTVKKMLNHNKTHKKHPPTVHLQSFEVALKIWCDVAIDFCSLGWWMDGWTVIDFMKNMFVC